MNKRFIISFLVIMLLMGIALPTHAQDFDCGQLSAEDCDTLNAAIVAAIEAGSLNNSEFSIELGGAGGTSDGNNLALTGSGPITFDENGVTAFAYTVEGGFSEDEITNAEIRLVGETLYLGGANEDGDMEWTGIPVDENTEGIIDVLSGQAVVEALQTPGSAILSRGDDIEVDGATIQVYEADVDLVTFVSSESIFAVIESLLASSLTQDAGEAGGLDLGGDIDLQGALQLLPLLLDRDVVQGTIWVDDATGALVGTGITLDLQVNTALITPDAGSLALSFNFLSQFDGLGDDYTIEAPAEYTEADPEDLTLDALPVDDILGGLSADAQADDTSDDERYAIENTFAYGELVTGTLGSDNIFDVWGFEASAGDVITITMQATGDGSSLDTSLFLRDPNGAEIAFNDDHIAGGSDLGIFDSQILAFEIPADGTYRIQATWLTETRDGDYQLIVEKAN